MLDHHREKAGLALVIGVISIPATREEEVDVHEASEVSEPPATQTTPELPADTELVDSDGDGLPDVVEENGWVTLGNKVYITDPHNPDTDGDGLSDLEEAGKWTGVGYIYHGLTDPTKADSDGDGLDDLTEIQGWTTERGESFFTNPMNPDTDGDGLPDGVEAEELVDKNEEGSVYSGFSDPTLVDTDDDGLTDAEEADHGTDPYLADTDGDGLSDWDEVIVIGTDPHVQDSDGDGFDDAFEEANRENQGLDPLFFDVQQSAWDHAHDFALGAFAGEFTRRDSVAWFAGNIAVAGAGVIGVGGAIISAFADLRDTIALSIQRDWVGAGFTAVALVTFGAVSAKIPKKVADFVDAYPHRAQEVAGVVSKLNWAPDSLKIAGLKIIWPSWDDLVEAGANPRGLLRLSTGTRASLDDINAAMKRSGHVPGASTAFLKDGEAGEKTLVQMYRKKNSTVELQRSEPIIGCDQVCNQYSRRFDVVVDGTAHESKVGWVDLKGKIRKQIHSDAHLVKTGVIDDAHWHFYPSDHTKQLGASRPVLASPRRAWDQVHNSSSGGQVDDSADFRTSLFALGGAKATRLRSSPLPLTLAHEVGERLGVDDP